MKLQARKFAAFERQAFRRADRVVTVTEADAALVRDRFGARDVDVVDNGIDRAFFESVTPARDPSEILFLGSLDWRPNLDALALLLDRIFPAVRALEPSARLTIVGRTPPLALERRVAETEGATLIANVPDVRPYLGRAGVLAVPLRIGGGSRLKILEALATGMPVVSTTVGAEGLELKHGEDLDIVDDPDAFATRLVETIRSPQRAQAMAARGRHFVLERYDWDALANLLERSWERCVEDRCVKL
jgi:glycosyltransferase involved in cell wall biosynthesis